MGILYDTISCTPFLLGEKTLHRPPPARNKTDLSRHYWTSAPFNPRVYVAIRRSIGTFCFPNMAVFHITSVFGI
jgi:hypothetical protein